MPCDGNGADHCCYISGVRCPHSEDSTVEGRRWVCGLRRALGDWDAVLASEEYRRDVAPTFEPLGLNCRDWPDREGDRCAQCEAR